MDEQQEKQQQQARATPRLTQVQRMLSMGGQSCQSEQQERWAEMRAWCGFLATNLEGACTRIEQLGEEKRIAERVHDSDRQAIKELKKRNSSHVADEREQEIERLKATIRDRDATIEQLHIDLREGKPVAMNQENKLMVADIVHASMKDLGIDQDKPVTLKRESTKGKLTAATRAALLAAAQAKAENQKTQEELDAEDLAAMPTWNMEDWLASLDMQKIVTDSILGHVRSSGGEVNPAVELLFMQKLARVGKRDTVLALLRASSVLDDITDRLWAGIKALCAAPSLTRVPRQNCNGS